MPRSRPGSGNGSRRGRPHGPGAISRPPTPFGRSCSSAGSRSRTVRRERGGGRSADRRAWLDRYGERHGVTGVRPEQLEWYVAIGDSMSIDRYPSLDLVTRNPPSSEVVKALRARAGRRAGGDLPIGAASLLASNADEIWPEYAGRDLRSLAPAARAVDV